VEGSFGRPEGGVTASTVTARVVDDAKRRYGQLADDVVLERMATEAVSRVWTESIRVTSFVPVLAMRHVRDMLEGRSEPSGAAANGD